MYTRFLALTILSLLRSAELSASGLPNFYISDDPMDIDQSFIFDKMDIDF